MSLYAGPGRRRILPPLIFGAGVLWHLLRQGDRYDVVHTASFPYFSLLAAALVRPLHRYRLVVDWHEVWTRSYWREYLGRAGEIGWWVQRLCMHPPQRAFCFSRLHAARLRKEGFRGALSVLPGEYEGPLEPMPVRDAHPLVVFAGRHIPEKQVRSIPAAIARARAAIPELRAIIFGDGPDREAAIEDIERLGLAGAIEAPGFVSVEEIDAALSGALCMLLPSRREGYGLVVLEAAVRGTPSIVVAGADNAAVELVSDGENGCIAPSASPEDLAAEIVRVHRAGRSLRVSTADWFARNARDLSITSSINTVLAAYGHEAGFPDERVGESPYPRIRHDI
jgi:glycosyltransferase involved in cell wall biosynthesis